MSGELLAPEGFPLTLRLSKGERKSFFNGLLKGADRQDNGLQSGEL